MPNLTNAAAEVIELHQFFEDWFTGRVDKTEAVFARFTQVTAPDFHLVSPAGSMADLTQVAPWIWEMHGTRPTSRLWVEKIALTSQGDGFCVVTYEEWQESPEERKVRFSSALFVDDADAPHGLRWLHVHESWIG